MRRPLRLLVATALALAISGLAPVLVCAQQPPPAAPAADPSAPSAPPPAEPASAQKDGQAPAPKRDELPVDVERIKELAPKQSAVRLDDQQLRFYALALAKAPRFEDFVGDYDLKNGPTKGGAAMTHQEFVNMVTPRELSELFGATSGSSFAMFQAALMNALGQRLIRKAVLDMRQARDERELQAIRERIDRELAALLGR